ncbi:hypothetical protein PLESTB_001723600 [Pleodorina starrii]|uniref:Uncharacterized protein n=1 Tax=Pleodorina starrii TaxID=330485 RepID=A0A9W6C0H7_9CHLO|nr:hypothetical protein PLESTM_002009100 [Pleodorina starrii]GLC61150.1 hypothetical protein PLESTB_001723600 [Pleodorina starrii]GLC70110.1 hypothetical protein PLESTF_000925200 [Pleodorina starrii]
MMQEVLASPAVGMVRGMTCRVAGKAAVERYWVGEVCRAAQASSRMVDGCGQIEPGWMVVVVVTLAFQNLPLLQCLGLVGMMLVHQCRGPLLLALNEPRVVLLP